jgi:1,4-dihydroxy-2-naphthoyl-CoA hydrolase
MAFSYCRNIYLSDTDAAGVIYFAQGLSICHEAYEEWLKSLGLSIQQILTEKKIALPIVHGEIDFLQPITCGDALEIKLEIQEVKEKRIAIAYTIFKPASPDEVLAKAITIHVCINPQTRQKTTFPNEMLEVIRV